MESSPVFTKKTLVIAIAAATFMPLANADIIGGLEQDGSGLAGPTVVTRGLDVSGATTLASPTLGVSGATTLDSTLDVVGCYYSRQYSGRIGCYYSRQYSGRSRVLLL